MSRRLKMNLIAGAVILAFSYWAANPGFERGQFHLLPIGAKGTLATALGWLIRITIISGIFYIARVAWRNVRSTASGGDDQAVIIKLKLSTELGSLAEVEKAHALEDELERTIVSSGIGELDGDEFGGGYCTIYLYGPDAEKLFGSIRPVLKEFPAPAGSFVVRRFGNVWSAVRLQARTCWNET